MRAGLSTIQQTLTPEAANVINLSIAEASRRNHGQTTPLHVAATLLASPSGYLRQACIRSHPNSSHPLQCRALELCFSVALERLPTAQNMEGTGMEPPISNALMAALKRAQAHQRRGCPEQQQQPLLAVKVELEQLIISILDDPSVSRVMREASFSSPAVKAAIEQSLNSSNTHASHHQHHVSVGNVNFGSSIGGIGPRLLPNPTQLMPPSPSPSQIGPRLLSNPQLTPPSPSPSQIGPNRNVYLNPRLQQGNTQITNPKGDDLKKVFDIMSRSNKRNPILVGDSEPETVVKEYLRKIANNDFGGDLNFKNIQVVPMERLLLSDKNQIALKMEELGGLIENRVRNGGVILDLGDLKWLVEQPASLGLQPQKRQVAPEMGALAVAEMKKLLARFNGGESGNKLWLIGTATCETYLRCQVYHSSMENDWDLQAVPIASRSPLPGMFPRLGTERLLSNPAESLTNRVLENSTTPQKSSLCPQCSQSYDKELAKLASIEKSFSESKQATQPSLPAWLQNAKAKDEPQTKDQGVLSKQKTQDLQKKWSDTCLHLHPNFHQKTRSDRPGPPTLSMTSLYNPNLLSRPPFQPKLQMAKPLGAALQLNMNQVPTRPTELVNSNPRSPVRTDLNLGWKGPEKDQDQAKDLLGCISSEPQTKLLDKFANALDADTYKKLLKGLMEKAWWQAEAASAVASAITRCRLGNGKRHGAGTRGDIWLLFTGPDRVGKKKMASVLAEQMFGTNPVMICLGKRRDGEESDTNIRGKTSVDRIAEAVRRNPFLVIMLEDIDEADMIVRGSIKRAVERGRITDSHGREVGLGNAIFVVTGDWSTTSGDALKDGRFVDEKKVASIASGGWQLGLIVREKSGKRKGSWLQDDDDRSIKARGEMGNGLSLDLNLAAAFIEDEKTDGSSDLTIDHEEDLSLLSENFSITSVPHDLVSNVDDSIVFKPVSSAFVRKEIKKTISVKFSMVVDEKVSIEVEDDVLEKIIGGLWQDSSSLEGWVEKVLEPSFEEVKTRLSGRSNAVVRLVVESDSDSGSVNRVKSNGSAEWLPSTIMV